MDQASRALVEAGVGEDPYGIPAEDLLPLRLAAADAVVAERRTQVPILERRARDAGVERIKRTSDLVPLLLPHTAYKSYPATFVARKRWPDLARWLSGLSTADLTGVDFDGVLDEDGWVDRLRDAGHFVLATSGTTGKCSFLPHSDADHERKVAAFGRLLGWPFTRPDRGRGYFWLGPHHGVNSMVDAANIGAELWSTPDRSFFLTDERLLLTDVSRMAAMRKRMAEGTATPSEIRDFEGEQAARTARMTEGIDTFIDLLLAHRHEPLVIAGAWAQHLMVRERARELGVPDADFEARTIVSAGGGVKNVAMPPDYKERVATFYGDVLRTGAYGMTELFGLMSRCEKLRYHVPPPVLPMVLDRTGETLLSTEDITGEVVEGRFAFVDFSVTGRWSGMITSDRVELDTNPVCLCGRPGPTILDTITRYQTDDDTIGCAGTVDSYLRGALAP